MVLALRMNALLLDRLAGSFVAFRGTPMFNFEPLRTLAWIGLVELVGAVHLSSSSQLYADESSDGAKSHANDSLTLRVVQLFPSGQGVFEYQGSSIRDVTLEMSLTRNEIDDVLKSLTLKGFDRANLHFEGESIASTANAIDLGTDTTSTLAEMLQGMRGRQLKVIHAGETIDGSIVTVELQSSIVQGVETDREVISLMTNGVIRQFELAKLTQFAFADPDVQSRFQRELLRVADTQPMRQRAMLRVENREAKDGAIIFQHQVAPWKLAYRIAKIDGAYQLIGSAVIDNTSGRDWVDVSLDLVVDQPFGFHAPLGVVQQPLQYSIDLPKPFSSAPPSIRAGVRRDSAAVLVDRFAPNRSLFDARESNGMAGSGSFGKGGLADAGATEGMAGGMGGMGRVQGGQVNSSSEVNAKSFEQGSDAARGITRFGVTMAMVDSNTSRKGPRVKVTIPHLTVESGSSTNQFLPKIDAKVEPKQIYVPSVSEHHPLSAFELLLPEGSQLLGGPGTVWGSDGYEGDIVVPHLSGSHPQLVTYALNSAIDIATSDSVRKLEPQWRLMERGRIEMIETEEKKRLYTIVNRDNKEHRVVIEHRHETTNRKIRSSNQPVERLSSEKNFETLRFEIRVGPKESKPLEVTESTQAIVHLESKTTEKVDIERYLKEANLPVDVTAQLREWLDSEIASRKKIEAISKLTAERESVLKELNRIQAWLKTLHREDEIYNRYVKKLDDLENRLEMLESKLAL